MIPANEWWMVLQNYNETVFPAQILFYLLAIGAISVSFWQTEKVANRLIKGFFVLTFGWIGIVFFLLLGQKLPAHNAQAFLFLSLSALFAIDLFTETSQFKIPLSGWQRTATLVGFGLVLVYPLVGLLLGRPTVRLIVPGTFPCPTTALALVFMATTLPVKRRWLFLATLCLLLIWAIPFPIMIQIPQFGVYEDGIMLAAGIYSLVMLVINWNTTKVTKR
jgi:hypothetical protein